MNGGQLFRMAGGLNDAVILLEADNLSKVRFLHNFL
jgi:hypothetical protein